MGHCGRCGRLLAETSIISSGAGATDVWLSPGRKNLVDQFGFAPDLRSSLPAPIVPALRGRDQGGPSTPADLLCAFAADRFGRGAEATRLAR